MQINTIQKKNVLQNIKMIANAELRASAALEQIILASSLNPHQKKKKFTSFCV